MKRFVWLLLITLTLVACSRKRPTPTSTPSPTLPSSPTPTAQATFIPQEPPAAPRITIVPSATRLQPTLPSETRTPSASPTRVEEPPTPTLSFTPTPHVIDTGATDTPLPTATLSDSFLPAPTSSESSDALLTETPLPSATLTPSPASEEPTATSRSVPGATDESPTSTATVTSTPTPTPTGEDWSYEQTFVYYDEDYEELYILGRVVNNTDSNQIISSLIPIIYDEDGYPLTGEEDAISLLSYELLQTISLDPGSSLPFGFVVIYLPEGFDPYLIEERYGFEIQAGPTEETTREDLGISITGDGSAEWPDYFYVEGNYTIPSPDLEQYIAIIVALYDEDERVVGVGEWLSTDPFDREIGEHDFFVDVELEEFIYLLELEMNEVYRVQLFGY